MKKIAFYFSKVEPIKGLMESKYPYWKIYQGIIKGIEKQMIDVYIVGGPKVYLGNGVFTDGWQIKNGEPILINQPIKVDIIYHQGKYASIPKSYDWPMINHPDMERFCRDKVKTAQLFPDISPKSKAINSYQEYVNTVAEWNVLSEEKIVLKKNFLYGGDGVYILPAKNVIKNLYENWEDVLMQEFIDSSIGIPGVVDGLHDIRIISFNGEPVFSFVRTPPDGSFLANVAKGGAEFAVSLDKIPTNLLKIFNKINKKFSDYRPSIMAVDFFNSRDGFKLIELTCPPGMLDPNLSPEYKQFNEDLVQMLVREVSSLPKIL